MRTFVSLMIGAAVLATAVVSVRLHLLVVGQRYGLANLMEEHERADRALRRANADLEALKAPRKLMDRWAEMQGAQAAARPPAARPAPPDAPLELEGTGVHDDPVAQGAGATTDATTDAADDPAPEEGREPPESGGAR